MREGELQAIAQEEVPILLLSQDGVDADGVARQLHLASRFCRGPFLRYKCGSFEDPCQSAQRLERECARLFLLARGGTLFFRNVHRLMPSEQRQLFSILEHGRFWVPDNHIAHAVDFRVLASTTREELDAPQQSDLLYRLAERVLCLPAASKTGEA